MNEDQKQEREDWEALLASPGWVRFVSAVKDQWTGGEAFKRRIMACDPNIPSGFTEAQVKSAVTALDEMTIYPRRRLSQLQALASQAEDKFAAQRRAR